ncbi:MAG: ATP-grasp domain-containing protein [Acidobacteria bacterium]|nr:MAG: ATP-grasp domain-containing protein [Acidobacteriota bacterium]
MFRRLMVANRGEVAVRIARTCARLGIETVCAVSEADRRAPWLDAFDRVICIGAAAPARSYLSQEAILQAAVQEEVQALHPGWGFLAENALFAARVRQLGIAWVGPSPHSLRLMGDKALARRTMEEAGLPTIPGSRGLLAGPDEAEAVASEVGYPVVLKAAAGGGGKGIRRCDGPEELRAAFAEASREAAAAFGHPGLYLEKFIEHGRHIEFQLAGDGHGAAVHLGERECSVQRRHQKLIEESPSPVVDDATRRTTGEAAARAVAALRYAGVGTAEFLRDADGRLFFMEMNTRLQVEHPVTEMVTGLDLVEWQLRIAAGEPLPARQEEIRWEGHAIEARINAEDPAEDFRPCPGTIESMRFPGDAGPGRVRVDTHVRPPCEVPPFYDSMIAKVIAHGRDREEARQTLLRCLERSEVEGVATTIPAHLVLLSHPAFASGAYDTSLAGGLFGAPAAGEAT